MNSLTNIVDKAGNGKDPFVEVIEILVDKVEALTERIEELTEKINNISTDYEEDIISYD